MNRMDLAGRTVGQQYFRKGIIDGPQEERWARSSCRLQPETIRNRPGANKPGGWVVQRMGQAPPAPSGRKRQGAQSTPSGPTPGFVRASPGRIQSEAATLRVSTADQGKGQRAADHGLPVWSLSSHPRDPNMHVRRLRVVPEIYRERSTWTASAGNSFPAKRPFPRGDGGSARRRTSGLGWRFRSRRLRRWSASRSEGVPVPVGGDEAVIAVGGEEGQLGPGRGLHPPDDEPHGVLA